MYRFIQNYWQACGDCRENSGRPQGHNQLDCSSEVRRTPVLALCPVFSTGRYHTITLVQCTARLYFRFKVLHVIVERDDNRTLRMWRWA